MELNRLANIPPWEWPEDAAGSLLGVIDNPRADVADRKLAAQLAGDISVINDTLADALLAVAGRAGEPDELRESAAISLGAVLEYADTMEFEDVDDILISEHAFRRIQDGLHRLFKDKGLPVDVRRRILEASVRAPRDWHPEAVREAYESKDPAWQLTAVFCMGYVHGFKKQILESLNSKIRNIRYHAICAAGNWEIAEAWPKVVGIIENEKKDKEMLLAAIDAVVGIRPQDAAAVLGPLLHSSDEDIVEAVHESLSMAEVIMENDESGEDGDQFDYDDDAFGDDEYDDYDDYGDEADDDGGGDVFR